MLPQSEPLAGPEQHNQVTTLPRKRLADETEPGRRQLVSQGSSTDSAQIHGLGKSERDQSDSNDSDEDDPLNDLDALERRIEQRALTDAGETQDTDDESGDEDALKSDDRREKAKSQTVLAVSAPPTECHPYLPIPPFPRGFNPTGTPKSLRPKKVSTAAWDNNETFKDKTVQDILGGELHPNDICGTLYVERIVPFYNSGDVKERLNQLYTAFGLTQPRTNYHSKRFTRALWEQVQKSGIKDDQTYKSIRDEVKRMRPLKPQNQNTEVPPPPATATSFSTTSQPAAQRQAPSPTRQYSGPFAPATHDLVAQIIKRHAHHPTQSAAGLSFAQSVSATSGRSPSTSLSAARSKSAQSAGISSGYATRSAQSAPRLTYVQGTSPTPGHIPTRLPPAFQSQPLLPRSSDARAVPPSLITASGDRYMVNGQIIDHVHACKLLYQDNEFLRSRLADFQGRLDYYEQNDNILARLNRQDIAALAVKDENATHFHRELDLAREEVGDLAMELEEKEQKIQDLKKRLADKRDGDDDLQVHAGYLSEQ